MVPGTLTDGSAMTYRGSRANLPPSGPIAVLDYIGPLAEMMKASIPQTSDTCARYKAYLDLKYYLCPSADGILSTAYTSGGGQDAGQLQTLGYVTVTSFLFTTAASSTANQYPGVTGYTRISSGAGWWKIPTNYFPKYSAIGNSSEKVFLCDGSKFNQASGLTYDLDPYPAPNASAILPTIRITAPSRR